MIRLNKGGYGWVGFPIYQDLSTTCTPTIDLNFILFPPRWIAAFKPTQMDLDAIGTNLTSEIHTEIFSAAIVQRCAIILINSSLAIRPGVNTQRKRPQGNFFGALCQRLHRDNGTSSRINRQHIQFRLDFLCSCHARAGPIVKPLTGWESYFVAIQLIGKTKWCDQQTGTEHELIRNIKIEGVTVFGRRRKFQEHRPHNRKPIARHFFHSRIKIRKQAVALFYISPPDRFVFGAMDPRLLIAGSLRSVIAINRLEGCKFNPFCQKVGLWSTGKTADVSTSHAEPT